MCDHARRDSVGLGSEESYEGGRIANFPPLMGICDEALGLTVSSVQSPR